jgi:NTE family protein
MTTLPITGVFEGGGVRGVALAGAAAAALDHGFRFARSVGTSAGALVGSLVAAGYEPEELARAVRSVGWPSLLDPVPGAKIPLVGKHLALVLRRGLYKGAELERVWGDLLARKGVVNFGDLPPGALSVVTTDLSHGRGVSMPEDLPLYGVEPDAFPISRAVRMSASVPFLFTPVALRDERSGESVLMSDGAMAANFPIGLAGHDRPIVGFRLVTDATSHPHTTIGGPASLARAVVIAGIRARYDLPRDPVPGASIIEVPVSADLDFEMDRATASAVFDRGRKSASAQLTELAEPSGQLYSMG